MSFAEIQVLEGKYHNMHAESPDLIMSLVNDFVVTCYKEHPKITDFEYYKKYGSDYKLILRKKKLHDLLETIRIFLANYRNNGVLSLFISI